MSVNQEDCTCYTEEQCDAANTADVPDVADAASDSAESDEAASDGASSDGAESDGAATNDADSDTASSDENNNADRDRGLGEAAIKLP